MRHILKCTKCHNFTMNELCACSEKTVAVQPLKYSPQDKYGGYRRKIKEQERRGEGLL